MSIFWEKIADFAVLCEFSQLRNIKTIHFITGSVKGRVFIICYHLEESPATERLHAVSRWPRLCVLQANNTHKVRTLKFFTVCKEALCTLHRCVDMKCTEEHVMK